MCLEKNLRKIIYNNFKYCTFRIKHILHDIMSTKEKEAAAKQDKRARKRGFVSEIGRASCRERV